MVRSVLLTGVNTPVGAAGVGASGGISATVGAAASFDGNAASFDGTAASFDGRAAASDGTAESSSSASSQPLSTIASVAAARTEQVFMGLLWIY